MKEDEQKNSGVIEVDISFLQWFVLNIENELKFYEITSKSFTAEAKNIRDQYKNSIEIERFLQYVSRIDDGAELKRIYAEFKEKKADADIKYGDIFSLDIGSKINDNQVIYGLQLNKVNPDIFAPRIGTTKLFQAKVALRKSGEKAVSGMIQSFEEFFAKILRRLIISKPEVYLGDKNIPYGQIVKTDFEVLRQELVNQEIEKLMYDVQGTIAKINKIHELKLENYQGLWNEIVQFDLHRNIIVHNEGKVNAAYLKNIPSEVKNNYTIGKYIVCSRALLQNMAQKLIEFGFLLSYLIGESEEEKQYLEDVAFDFLKKQRWELAEFSYDLLLRLKDIGHEERLIYKINALNAKKHMKGLDHIREEIDKLDVSGMEERYKIAKYLLLEENDLVTASLEKSYPNMFNSYLICTWPLFIEYRKTQEYKDFRERHKEDFEPYSYENNTN